MKNKVLKTYPLPHGFCPDRVDHGEKGGPGVDFGDQAVRHRVTPFARDRHEKWVDRFPAGERDDARFCCRTITDLDGNFMLSNVPSKGILVVSYIGYGAA